MARQLRLVVLLVVTVLLQVAVFPRFAVVDAAPWVALVATAALGYRSGPESGLLFGFAAGLAVDLFLETPLGLSALAYSITGYVVGLVESGLIRASVWITPLIGGMAGLLGGAIYVTVGILAGQDQLMTARSLTIVFVSALYDAVLSPLVFPFATWADSDPTHAGTWRAR
ncbi:MAG: rod shape-determining protein MreD [Acidimicrobiia bacterium]